MAEFASKGVGNAALTTGIIGTAGWALNGGLANLLGGITGGGNAGRHNDCDDTALMAAVAAMVAGVNGACNGGNHDYTRYDAGKDARIAELETEVKLRDANTYTDQKLLEVYKYFDGKVEGINQKLCEQAVWNTAQTGTISCMAQQIAALNGLTKLVIPGASICPEMMPRYNSWTAPTAQAASGT